MQILLFCTLIVKPLVSIILYGISHPRSKPALPPPGYCRSSAYPTNGHSITVAFCYYAIAELFLTSLAEIPLSSNCNIFQSAYCLITN